MWEKLRNAFAVPDLKNKILFTLGMLFVFRLVAHIPVPGVDHTALQNLYNNKGQDNVGQILGLLDVFSGGSLSLFSIAALGVYPYITASIVMQLMMPIIPRLEAMAKEGESGRNRIAQYTRFLTIPLAFLQGLGQGALLQNYGIVKNFNLFSSQYFLSTFAILITLTTGTIFLVWLGELITENGIGNGISLIIFGGIVSRLPSLVAQGAATSGSQTNTSQAVIGWVVFLAIGLLAIIAIVFMYQAQRRIPVQYAKRMVGRRLMQGQATFLPLQVNSAGMIPLIFAQSILIFPVVLSSYLALSSNKAISNAASYIRDHFNQQHFYYWALYFILVVMFSYFYTAVVFQQQNIPENLQRQGGFIPGIRPGRPTAEYLNKVVVRITVAGALFLGIIAILPYLARSGGNQLLSSAALLIVVGVVLDTVKQLESQLIMRNYSGFLR